VTAKYATTLMTSGKLELLIAENVPSRKYLRLFGSRQACSQIKSVNGIGGLIVAISCRETIAEDRFCFQGDPTPQYGIASEEKRRSMRLGLLCLGACAPEIAVIPIGRGPEALYSRQPPGIDGFLRGVRRGPPDPMVSRIEH